jgi:L-malate glycosyltransferase
MMPRVLQVILSFNPGGTERLVLELAARLHADMPMKVVCLDEVGPWAHEIQSLGIEVEALQRSGGFRPELGRAIARAATRHGATVIHAHQYSPFVYSALARLWRPGLQVVFTEHGRLSDAPPSAKRRSANLVLRNFPRRVFSVSEDLKRHLVAEGFKGESVDVIYNGIDVGPPPDPGARAQARTLLGISDDDLVIGTIGRLDPVKDFETLIRAVGGLSGSLRAQLVIVGDGPERSRLERLAGEQPAGSRVRLLGHRDNARQSLPALDIFVNSSISEGISLTILEAMAAGLPVIATGVGGTPEVVDESCGRLVPARDTAAIAAMLASLAAEPALRRQLGRRARQRVETRFTLDRMIGEYRAAYESASR